MQYKDYENAILALGIILFTILEHAYDDEDIPYEEYMSLEKLVCDQFSLDDEV